MRVAVTGSNGFFAKYLIAELSQNGHTVLAIDKTEGRKYQAGIEFIAADLTVMSEAKIALADVDAVLHLAGIPHPLEQTADEIYKANALGTFVTAWTAGELGIKTFVYASSESVLGNAFHPSDFKPDSFPIDERHPTFPLDPYGISKVAGEYAVQSSAERFGFAAAALRMPWIWGADDPERLAFYKDLIQNYPNWKKNLWAYVDARDAAIAFRLTLEADLKPAQLVAYFIAADQHWVAPQRTTLSLVEEFYPGTHFNPDPDNYVSLLSNVKAKNDLGWHPDFSRELLESLKT